MVFWCPVFAVAVCFRWFCPVGCLFGWLNVCNAELSLKRSQEMEEDSCIKMGSDENRFNISLIVRGQDTRQFPQITTFEEKG